MPDPVYAYGHSFMASDLGGTTPTQRYPALVAAQLGATLTLRAQDGARTRDVAAWLTTGDWQWVPPVAHTAVLVDATINDILWHTPLGVRSYSVYLDRAADILAGSVVVLVWPLRCRPPHPSADPAITGSYGDALRWVADRHGFAIADASAAWEPTMHTGADGIHPTVAGHQVIATAVLDVLA